MSIKDAEVETEQRQKIIIYRNIRHSSKSQDFNNFINQNPIPLHVSSLSLYEDQFSALPPIQNTSICNEVKRANQSIQCSSNTSPFRSINLLSKQSSSQSTRRYNLKYPTISHSVVNINDRTIGESPLKRVVESFQFPVHIGDDPVRDTKFKKTLNRVSIRNRQLGYFKKKIISRGLTSESRKRLVINLYNPTKVGTY